VGVRRARNTAPVPIRLARIAPSLRVTACWMEAGHGAGAWRGGWWTVVVGMSGSPRALADSTRCVRTAGLEWPWTATARGAHEVRRRQEDRLATACGLGWSDGDEGLGPLLGAGVLQLAALEQPDRVFRSSVAYTGDESTGKRGRAAAPVGSRTTHRGRGRVPRFSAIRRASLRRFARPGCPRIT
jgi:hypothetical protein